MASAPADQPPRIPVRGIRLRCASCKRLLAELISPPYRIKCRCGTVNEKRTGEVIELEVRR